MNRCFDDIEKFIARLQHAAAAFRELEKRRRSRKSKKKDLGDGMLSVRAKPPPEREFINIFQKFNNGAVDIAGGPGIVYEMMELHKGLEPNGGILSEPIIQASMQFVGRSAKLPEGFGQKSRQYFVDNFDNSLKIIRDAEEKIPKKWWITLPVERRDEYNAETRKVRVTFRDQGVYDAKMLTLLRKIRCRIDATLAECSAKDAE